MASEKHTSSVKVVCRIRPLNVAESDGPSCCHVPEKNTVTLFHPRTVGGGTGTQSSSAAVDSRKFCFDSVFGTATTQAEIYSDVGKPILEAVLEGYNGTIFAYGQTSSGKTYTMEGPDFSDENSRGIIPRLLSDVFVGIENADDNIEFTIKASMIEIYMERIGDLLDPSNSGLRIREDAERGIWVDGAREEVNYFFCFAIKPNANNMFCFCYFYSVHCFARRCGCNHVAGRQ